MWLITGDISNGFCTPRGHDEQRNMRLDQAQGKMMDSRYKHEIYEIAAGVTQCSVL